MDDVTTTPGGAVAPTPRLKALQTLQQQLPVGNSQIAGGYQAARDLQLQRAVAAQPTGGNISGAASQIGGQMAAEAGQQNLALAGQAQQQAGQLGGLALGEEQQAQQARSAGQQQALGQQQMDSSSRLAALSESTKNEVLDQRLQFSKDEAGRTLFNERQLADYQRLQGATQQQMANYAQQSTQLNDMKLQAMSTANQKLQAALKNENALRQQGMDDQQIQDLYTLQRNTNLEIQKMQNSQANRNAIFQTFGTITGAAAGGVVGGPAELWLVLLLVVL